MYQTIPVEEAVDMLAAIPPKRRNLQMPGDPHYQPVPLRPYLGYDARVGWYVLAEWYWMYALASCGIMPRNDAELLTRELLQKLLRITTTQVTRVERNLTKHDILALLRLMRLVLPRELHRWLHLGCTSYDIICTANALQVFWTFNKVFYPKAKEVDVLWRERIAEYATPVQCGRTHLQTALPVTVGIWLSILHSRFVGSITEAHERVCKVPGKFSGATGTKAAIRALQRATGNRESDLEDVALEMLGLPCRLSTQITQPEALARFYYETTLLSGALANLGDDIRHLQMPEVGEVHTTSAGSSAMSHKISNPVAAEQIDGMHITVRCENDKVTQTLVSTLQRVLTGSSVMRGYPAILVFTYQQLTTAERIFRSFRADAERCEENLEKYGKLTVAELLHLALQMQGMPEAHTLVNRKIVPRARASGRDLRDEMDHFAKRSRSARLREAWAAVPEDIKEQLAHPETYIGDAVLMAQGEAMNIL